ncbi:MAG TPA: cupin domain-containing protein [Castellaniella sp.]|nr:cupin domain-containing protein [Castellaniella sp.]
MTDPHPDSDPAPHMALSTGPDDWQALVASLGLQAHPEGGYYREVFRSDLQVPFHGASRCAGTSIYYLLAQGAYSAWHRIDADETWYFHTGGPLELYVLSPEGDLRVHRLGDPRHHPGAVFQAMVAAGCWFAAKPAMPGDFALVGCAVAPGFEFRGFQLAVTADMEPAIRRHGDWVRSLLKQPG